MKKSQVLMKHHNEMVMKEPQSLMKTVALYTLALGQLS